MAFCVTFSALEVISSIEAEICSAVEASAWLFSEILPIDLLILFAEIAISFEDAWLSLIIFCKLSMKEFRLIEISPISSKLYEFVFWLKIPFDMASTTSELLTK